MKKAVTSVILSGLLILGSGASTLAQNTSETGTGTRTTRDGKVSSDSTRVRGDMEGFYYNEDSGDFIGFLRMDMESSFAADYMLDSMSDPDLMAEELDMDIEGTFRVRGMGDCAGLYGEESGFDIFIVYCVDGTYANLMMGSDKSDILDVMDGVQNDGELVIPEGYVEDELD